MTSRGPGVRALLPWQVPGVRTGREWVRGVAPEVVRTRWQRLAGAEDVERARLFRVSRSRRLTSSVAQLPGQAGDTHRLSLGVGVCPAPVRVRLGAFDRQWLLPDARLLDRPHPELWRVADRHQIFAQLLPGPEVAFTAEPPLAAVTLPFFRRPGGQEPNLVPGLTDCLTAQLKSPVTASDVFAWIAAVTAHPAARTLGGDDLEVPLPRDPALWSRGLELGRQVLAAHRFAADRPRLPGGRRPFVRQPVNSRWTPTAPGYEAETETLLLGDEGRISPVPAAVAAQPALTAWFAERTAHHSAEPGTLEALGLVGWPQQLTAELVDLLGVLAAVTALHPAQAELSDAAAVADPVTAAELHRAGLLPAPSAATRPASVLDHREEGPEGQFALL